MNGTDETYGTNGRGPLRTAGPTCAAIAALMLMLGSAAAADRHIDFARSMEVTNGMGTNQLVAIMGKPTSKAMSDVLGVDLWVWASQAKKNPESLSFAIYDGKVAQTPIHLTNELSKDELRRLVEKRNAELRMAVDEIDKARREKEVTDFIRRDWLSRFPKQYPDVDMNLVASVQRGETHPTNASHLYFEGRKKAQMDLLDAMHEKTVQYLRAHAEQLKPSVMKGLSEGHPAVGMTAEELKMALVFPPDEKNMAADASGEREIWTWEKNALRVTLQNGVVSSWEQTKRNAAK